MTKEEAIKILKKDKALCEFNPTTGEDKPISEDCRKSAEALDVAIKALEQQPCEDCVSRQAVLAIANDSCLDLDNYEDTKEFCDEIKDLPPVTPTQRWIPVSEELPKENGWYQCTVILNDLPRTMELFYKNSKWLDNRRINMFDTYDIYGYGNTKEKHKLSYQELISEFEWNQVVIAWQPLPQPYEEKRGNEDDMDRDSL